VLRDDWVIIHSDTVQVEPVAKGRPRTFKQGRYYKTITPEKTKEFERKLAWLFASALTLRKLKKIDRDQAVGVSILCVHTRPKSMRTARHSGDLIWKTTKPDSDNLAKAVLDSLVKSGILDDDAQIVWHECGKAYSEYSHEEKRVTPGRVSIELFALRGDVET
tara:strand:- start:791 stop:1279 length:489 start_codon:yes stop_codon:yes gene_type:complete